MPKCLIVEHDPFVATDLFMILDDNGYDVDVAHGNLNQICAYIEGKSYDIATLDVNFMGESIEPVASVLTRMGVPFVYVTGTTPKDPLSFDLPEADYLPKPFMENDLLKVLAKNLGPEVPNRGFGLPSQSQVTAIAV